MSIFVRREARTQTADTVLAAARGLRNGTMNTAGQVVTRDTANALMAVWRCKMLLADIVAGLPYHQYRDQADTRVRMREGSIVAEPSEFVDDVGWRTQMMLSALDVGNGFAYVTQLDGAGRIAKAEVLDPADVSVARSGALAPPVWKVGRKEVDADRMLHLPAFGPTPGSVLGMAPLEYARQTIGLGLAVRAYGADWYRSGGHPTAVLTTDRKIDTTAAEEAKARFREATLTDHLAALGSGWKYEAVQVQPDQALFLAATNATAVDVCGYFGVPPEFLGLAVSGSSVTYANREQRALDLLTYTVQWWVGRFERLYTRVLPKPQYVKASFDALLRVDLLTRYRAHDLALRDGWKNRDEIRRIEELAPLPEAQGDEYLWPPYRAFPIESDSTPAADTTPADQPQGGA